MRPRVACWLLWLLLGSAMARLGEDQPDARQANPGVGPAVEGEQSTEDTVGMESYETGIRMLKGRVDSLFFDKTDDDEVEVMIGYKSDRARSRAKSAAARHRKKAKSRKSRKRKEKDFVRISAMAITVTKKELKELELDEDIDYIEPDRELQMMGNIVPYGIRLTQGANAQIARPANPALAGNCSNPNALRVATIDSGIDGNHVDLQCQRNNGVGCIGKSFGISDAWNNDKFSHGTVWCTRIVNIRMSERPHIVPSFRHPCGRNDCRHRWQQSRRAWNDSRWGHLPRDW
jgi:Peptidase inhibitor I9